MISFSWQYDFMGAARTWMVTIMFCATGMICGLIIPFFISPADPAGSVSADGVVVRMEMDDGMEQPIFQFADQAGVVREFSSGIFSGRSEYRAGDRVTVTFNPSDPTTAFVQDDKDLILVVWILRILGFVFGSIGLAILSMKLSGMNDEVISRVGGLIGALTYAIPATFVLPGLWAAYGLRPNRLFTADAPFGFDQWLIGSVFSVTGLLALVGTVILYRYQTRTGKAGWYWKWGRSSRKKE
jgi:hypothetical protein